MSAPYYCLRCEEMLTETQSICPFCDGEAVTVDDALAAKFEARSRSFNERVQRTLESEERRRNG